MTPLQADNQHSTNGRQSGQIPVYPPPSTGTNYNLVGPVWVFPGDKVIWTVLNSPEGRFAVDYRVKRGRRKSCPGCRELIPRSWRKCDNCKAKAREDRNKRYYEKKRLRIKPS